MGVRARVRIERESEGDGEGEGEDEGVSVTVKTRMRVGLTVMVKLWVRVWMNVVLSATVRVACKCTYRTCCPAQPLAHTQIGNNFPPTPPFAEYDQLTRTLNNTSPAPESHASLTHTQPTHHPQKTE